MNERELLKKILEELGALGQKVDRLGHELRRTIMSKADDILSALNKATNDVAAEVEKLRQSLGDNISAEQAAQFDAITERLEGLAADPANPVPPAPAPSGGTPATP